MAELDLRPGLLNIDVYRGNPHTVVFDFGAPLGGRTFFFRIDPYGVPIDITTTVVGDTVTAVIPAVNIAAVAKLAWELVETTGAIDLGLIAGRLTVGISGGVPTTTAVDVTSSEGTVNVSTSAAVPVDSFFLEARVLSSLDVTAAIEADHIPGGARWRVWRMSAAVNTRVGVSGLRLPSHWRAVKVDVHWANESATVGNVVLRGRSAQFTAADPLDGLVSSGTDVVVAAPAVNTARIVTTLYSSLVVDTSKFLHIAAQRNGNAALDTLTSGVDVLGLEFTSV